MARAESAHVQPDGGGAGAAVKCEGERALGSISAIQRVCDEEHFRFDLAVASLNGKASGGCGVLERVAVDRNLVMSHNRRDFGHIEALFLLIIAGLRLGWRWRRLGFLSSGLFGLLGLALLRLVFLRLLLGLFRLFLRLVRLRTGLTVLLSGGKKNEQ